MGFRFPLAALLLIVISFVFFIIWAVMSFVLNVVSDVFLGQAGSMNPAAAAGMSSEINLLTMAFGVISLVLFIAGILVFFFFDVFKSETDSVIYEE